VSDAAETSGEQAAAQDGAGKAATQAVIAQAILPVALIVMLAAFALVEPRMISGANLTNILTQASYLFIFACAQMVVIITRGFDLSVGTNVSSVSVLAALVLTGMTGPDGEGAA